MCELELAKEMDGFQPDRTQLEAEIQMETYPDPMLVVTITSESAHVHRPTLTRPVPTRSAQLTSPSPCLPPTDSRAFA